MSAVIADPRFAAIFGPDALAEAPIAAVVEGDVIAGTVDRLLVTPERILVVDFQDQPPRTRRSGRGTAPPYPADGGLCGGAGRDFPRRIVEAALLYTAGPTLIEISRTQLEVHKPGFRGEQQMQGTGR